MWFAIEPAREKIKRLPDALAFAEKLTAPIRDGIKIGRDVDVVFPSRLPPKPGLSQPVGHARLIHDLASIEMQAMELAVRTLFEFPEAPQEFKDQLGQIALDEGRHLGLCLDALEALGHPWGTWAVHTSLWHTVGPEDTLLDRIAIVHRYLEGSGLDAGDMIQRRLSGVQDLGAQQVLNVIATEEVGHVLFGSRWFQRICNLQKLDSEDEFIARLARIYAMIPRREKLARDLRLRAGFTEREIQAMQDVQSMPTGSYASSMARGLVRDGNGRVIETQK